MGAFIDLLGMRFGRLMVIGRGGYQGRVIMWACRCDCGAAVMARASDMKLGKVRSCGCYDRERKTKHGAASKRRRPTPEYRSWCAMRDRCLHPDRPSYEHYGGRGIMVCDRWLHSFENFLSDMGPRPSRAHTLDRIDNDGNYEPSNCRWATRDEQRANQRPAVTFKITQADADAIRTRYAAGGISQQGLADEYGINQSHVSQIVRRVSWGDQVKTRKRYPDHSA